MKTTLAAWRARFLLGISCLVLALQAGATEGGKSAEQVANELANPNSTLGLMSFNNDYVSFDGDLPESGQQEAWRISFQPSLPYALSENTNLFVRPLIPMLIKQPVFDGTRFSDAGTDLGDIGFDIAVGTTFANGLVLIGGVTGTLDTATDDDVGRGQTLLGPEFLLGRKTNWGFLGVLVTHQWDIAGTDTFDTSLTGGQYFFTYNLQDGWQIQMQPTWSYDHEADSDDAWTLPLAFGVSKTHIIGKTPWKFSLQYWHYVASPDTFGPENQIRLQVTPVVPLPW